jgi:hypothetical protein
MVIFEIANRESWLTFKSYFNNQDLFQIVNKLKLISDYELGLPIAYYLFRSEMSIAKDLAN